MSLVVDNQKNSSEFFKCHSEQSQVSSLALSLRQVNFSFLRGQIGVLAVISAYVAWVMLPVYMVQRRYNFSQGSVQYQVVRGVKRGDKKYSVQLESKLRRLRKFGKHLVWFSRACHGVVSGSGLLVTLEYNSHNIEMLRAWQSTGVDCNRFFSHIRKLYGKFSIVRVWESHKSGYPHIHVLMVFSEFSFSGSRRWSEKEGKFRFMVDDVYEEKITSCWSHGYVDVRMADSFQGGLSYLLKYLTKSTSFCESYTDGDLKSLSGFSDSELKELQTLTMCWVLRLRSFAFSGNLFDVVDEMVVSSNSNYISDDAVFEVPVGLDFCGELIYEWVTRWRLAGFLSVFVALWVGWASRFVAAESLEIIDSSKGNHSKFLIDMSKASVDVVPEKVDFRLPVHKLRKSKPLVQIHSTGLCCVCGKNLTVPEFSANYASGALPIEYRCFTCRKKPVMVEVLNYRLLSVGEVCACMRCQHFVAFYKSGDGYFCRSCFNIIRALAVADGCKLVELPCTVGVAVSGDDYSYDGLQREKIDSDLPLKVSSDAPQGYHSLNCSICNELLMGNDWTSNDVTGLLPTHFKCIKKSLEK